MLKSYISGLLSEVKNKMVFLHMYQNRFLVHKGPGLL